MRVVGRVCEFEPRITCFTDRSDDTTCELPDPSAPRQKWRVAHAAVEAVSHHGMPPLQPGAAADASLPLLRTAASRHELHPPRPRARSHVPTQRPRGDRDSQSPRLTHIGTIVAQPSNRSTLESSNAVICSQVWLQAMTRSGCSGLS